MNHTNAMMNTEWTDFIQANVGKERKAKAKAEAKELN